MTKFVDTRPFTKGAKNFVERVLDHLNADERRNACDEESNFEEFVVRDCYARGFTLSDAVRYVRCWEDIRPELAEDVALKRMREINAKYDAPVTENLPYTITVMKADMKQYTYNLYWTRHENETLGMYRSRYYLLQLYAENLLSDVESILMVQHELVCAGFGLSNVIVLSVSSVL